MLSNALTWAQYPDLPLLIRARCHMVLSTRRDRSAVAHARESVRLLEEDGVELVGAEAVERQLGEMRRMLALAEANEEQGLNTLSDDEDDLEGEEEVNSEEEVESEEDAKDDVDVGRLQGISAADRLAIQEVLATDHRPTKRQRGLATPGATRTHTGQSRQSRPSRHASRQQALPTPQKEVAGGEEAEGVTLRETSEASQRAGYVVVEKDLVDPSEYVRYD